MHSREFVQHHNAGDTIILGISRSEFETKITREKPPRFWDKYFRGQNRIEIYELTSRDNRGYLTIPDYEQAYRADYKFDFWLLVLITIVVVCCYQWAKKQDRLDGLRR